MLKKMLISFKVLFKRNQVYFFFNFKRKKSFEKKLSRDLCKHIYVLTAIKLFQNGNL